MAQSERYAKVLLAFENENCLYIYKFVCVYVWSRDILWIFTLEKLCCIRNARLIANISHIYIFRLRRFIHFIRFEKLQPETQIADIFYCVHIFRHYFFFLLISFSRQAQKSFNPKIIIGWNWPRTIKAEQWTRVSWFTENKWFTL